MDRRCRINEQALNVIQAHGVAGLFVNPESMLTTEGSTASRSFPQKRNTALHHLGMGWFQSSQRTAKLCLRIFLS